MRENETRPIQTPLTRIHSNVIILQVQSGTSKKSGIIRIFSMQYAFLLLLLLLPLLQLFFLLIFFFIGIVLLLFSFALNASYVCACVFVFVRISIGFSCMRVHVCFSHSMTLGQSAPKMRAVRYIFARFRLWLAVKFTMRTLLSFIQSGTSTSTWRSWRD